MRENLPFGNNNHTKIIIRKQVVAFIKTIRTTLVVDRRVILESYSPEKNKIGITHDSLKPNEDVDAVGILLVDWRL
jgi:hypothetical protein